MTENQLIHLLIRHRNGCRFDLTIFLSLALQVISIKIIPFYLSLNLIICLKFEQFLCKIFVIQKTQIFHDWLMTAPVVLLDSNSAVKYPHCQVTEEDMLNRNLLMHLLNQKFDLWKQTQSDHLLCIYFRRNKTTARNWIKTGRNKHICAARLGFVLLKEYDPNIFWCAKSLDPCWFEKALRILQQ